MTTSPTRTVLRHLRRVARPEEPTDAELLDAFVLERDELAFAALLRRHGPMVWGVCRRVAGRVHDAEDAFQAVFLILVRRAGCIHPRARVGAWLYGVALRTARKARQLAERRQAREKQVEGRIERGITPEEIDSDLRGVIDDELRRLPEHLRLPVLLCDLEGQSQRQAARRLGLPVGTLGHRLEAARRRLAVRLARRGITLGAGILAVAAPPPALTAAVAHRAVALAAGHALGTLVSNNVLILIEGVMVNSVASFRAAAAGILLLALGGLGLHGLFGPAAAAGEDKPAAATPAEPRIDDRTFLRRISLDLRATLPTLLEMNYFVADADPAKRRKVVAWMLEKPQDLIADVPLLSALLLEKHRQGIYRFQPKLEMLDRRGGALKIDLVWTGHGRDEEFLQRLMIDLRGAAPTAVERHYYGDDADPKKREKIIDWLKSDPELGPKTAALLKTLARAAPARQRYASLLDSLLLAGRDERQMLEALTLATLARLPTDAEKQLLAAHLKDRADRRAAWDDLLTALLSTDEHQEMVESLRRDGTPR